MIDPYIAKLGRIPTDLDLVNASLRRLARIQEGDPDFTLGNPLPLCDRYYHAGSCSACPARAVTGAACQPAPWTLDDGLWTVEDELTFFCFVKAILEDLDD